MSFKIVVLSHFQLYKSRAKTLSQAECTEEDRRLWTYASPAVMSDQETDDEAGGQKKRYTFRRPEWRVEELTDIIIRIDIASQEPPRKYGEPSERKVNFSKIHNNALKPEHHTNANIPSRENDEDMPMQEVVEDAEVNEDVEVNEDAEGDGASEYGDDDMESD